MNGPDPIAIRSLARQARITGPAAVLLFGCSRRTWTNWCQGHTRMPHSAWVMLKRAAAEQEK